MLPEEIAPIPAASLRTSGLPSTAVSRARRRAGKIATAATSVIALVLASSYLLAPSQLALAVAVAVDRSVHVPAGEEIVYGTAVSSRGAPVQGVRLSVDLTAGRRLRTVASVKSRRDGTFRTTTRLAAGSYTIVVSEGSGRKAIKATRGIKLKPGYAYRITVKIVRTGVLSLFPVRTY